MAKSGKQTGKHKAKSGSEDAVDDEPVDEGSGETDEAPAKKSGKKSAKSKSVSGELKKSTGKMKAASGRRSGEVKAARPRGSGHELVPVICSECHEDFMFDTGVQSDSLTCPVCEHVAGRPGDAELHKIAECRRQEASAQMLALIFVGVGLAGFAAWAVLMADPANHADGGKFWGPLGVSLLSALLLAIFGAKYEGNRWETYF